MRGGRGGVFSVSTEGALLRKSPTPGLFPWDGRSRAELVELKRSKWTVGLGLRINSKGDIGKTK